MSDQGMFQRNINSDGSAAQSRSEGETIDSTSSVVFVDTSGGLVQVFLPDQVAAAGMRITIVNVDGGDVVRVSPTLGDSIDGIVDLSLQISDSPYASLTFASTGSSWANVMRI